MYYYKGPFIKDVGGLKFRYCKILEGRGLANQGQNSDMGERGVKYDQKISDGFYGRTPDGDDLEPNVFAAIRQT